MAAVQQMPRPILTLPEAALYLRLSERTLWALVREGRVPSFRLGKQHRFSLATLQEWAAAQSDNGSR